MHEINDLPLVPGKSLIPKPLFETKAYSSSNSCRMNLEINVALAAVSIISQYALSSGLNSGFPCIP